VGVRRFEDLVVWQLANQLHLALVKIADGPAGRRDLRFFDQLLGASRSISSNIAEGFGRYGRSEFNRFLHYARGSVAEVQAHLNEAEARAFITPAVLVELRTLTRRIAAALVALIGSMSDEPRPRR
jgi:four helix bundle protein